MLDNPKIRLSADKSPSTINDDVICSALGEFVPYRSAGEVGLSDTLGNSQKCHFK